MIIYCPQIPDFNILISFLGNGTLLLGGWDKLKMLDRLLILRNNGENWKESNIKLSYDVALHGAQFINNCFYIFDG